MDVGVEVGKFIANIDISVNMYINISYYIRYTHGCWRNLQYWRIRWIWRSVIVIVIYITVELYLITLDHDELIISWNYSGSGNRW